MSGENESAPVGQFHRNRRAPRSNETFVEGPRGPVRTTQPDDDQLQNDLKYQRDNGRPPVRIRSLNTMLDNASFATLIRIDAYLEMRGKINDDKFMLDKIEAEFQNFRDMVR
jgi:hypothetical protein